MARRLLSFLRGIFALFFRSLRVDSRSIRIHLTWFLLMVVIYISLWFAQEMSSLFGAPGLYFFRAVMYLDSAFITLLGISFFSTAITEEKEENTLGLMTMAGISPLGMLLGKSTSRLFHVLLLLAVQYPFTLLAVTMGGLLPSQIAAAYMSLVAYTILLANVGLLCSVMCRTSRNAAGLTTLWLIAYLVGPAFAYGGYTYLVSERGWSRSDWWTTSVLTSLDWISNSSVFMELYTATETSHRFEWSSQVIGNSAVGAFLFFFAWFLMRFVVRDPEPDTTTRGSVARITSRRLRWFSAGRAWRHPLVWKDFFFVAGGWGGLVVRCLLYSGLFGLCCLANSNSYSELGMLFRWEDVTHGFQAFAHPLLALDLALCASRLFYEEIRGQTMSSLLMLPQPVVKTAYSKILGCLLATTPGVIALFISFLMPGGMEFLGELWWQAGWWWWIMNLVLLIHLTLLFSVYLRTGALALAFGMTIGSMMLTGFVISVFAIALRGVERPDQVLIVCIIGQILVCLACHGLVIWRLPKLGEQ